MPKLVYLASPDCPPGLCIEVQTKEAHYAFCPNTLVVEALEGLPHITEPCATSELSGLPGYVYRTSNYDGETLTLRLTREELYRLISLSLTPEEFRKLADAHGIFHEIHDDFYDSDGTAWQPKEFPPLPTVEQLRERN